MLVTCYPCHSDNEALLPFRVPCFWLESRAAEYVSGGIDIIHMQLTCRCIGIWVPPLIVWIYTPLAPSILAQGCVHDGDDPCGVLARYEQRLALPWQGLGCAPTLCYLVWYTLIWGLCPAQQQANNYSSKALTRSFSNLTFCLA